MKICIYTDVHWSQTSSIVRDAGNKYSVRLEHLINSVNWAENLADEYTCDLICNLGDFFDKSYLNTQEISALSEIKWSSIPHKCLLGNHEIKDKNKNYSSLHLIKLLGFDLITEPEVFSDTKYDICYLPYMFEYDDILNIFPGNREKIVLSHNDVEGITLGGYTFESGFSLLDISKNCKLFLNGHIHAKGEYGNMINLGNLCGQNLGENGVPHNAYILDTETLELKEFKNPYSLNFYKVDLTKSSKLPKFKENPVVSLKCYEEDLEEVKDKFKDIETVSIKYTIVPKEIKENIIKEDIIQIDHLQSLREYILKNVGNDSMTKEELNIILN